MRRFRFSILGLLAFVAFIGVALGAIRNASQIVDEIVFTTTLLAFLGAIVAACLLRGISRAYWLGFALFGSTWLIVQLVPDVSRRLITTRATNALVDRFTIRTEITLETPNSVRSIFVNPDGSQKPGVIYGIEGGTGKLFFSKGPDIRLTSIASSFWAWGIGFLGGLFASWVAGKSRESLVKNAGDDAAPRS